MIFSSELSIHRLFESIGDIKETFLIEADEALNGRVKIRIVEKYKKAIAISSATVSVVAVVAVWVLQRHRGTKTA